MISKEPYTHETIPLDNGRVYILPIINVASDPPLSAEQEVIKYLWEKLKELAALTGSEMPEGPGRHNLTITVLLQQSPRGMIFEMNGKLFRAEDITGRWRKVE